MQRFEKKDMLLKAFEKIKLRQEKRKLGRNGSDNASDKSRQAKPGVVRKDENKSEEIRCFNCNQSGHRAKECTKPKRDRGSCYECGEQGHVLRNCPRKQKKPTVSADADSKKDTAQVTSVTEKSIVDNEYLKIIEFEMNSGETNFCFRVDTQFDPSRYALRAQLV